MSSSKKRSTELFFDVLYAIGAGIIVGTAYFFFQNSNGFAPGGVGGLATITHHLLADRISWSILMIAFNLPIFVLVGAVVNKKLGLILSIYMIVQSLVPRFYEALGANPYCLAVNGEDFNIVFACIATGVISGFGFSLMLRRFGASGGTYGISALIKKAKPEMNIAYVSFILDASVVFIAFFVYGMKVTPTICTLLNLVIANIIVDNQLPMWRADGSNPAEYLIFFGDTSAITFADEARVKNKLDSVEEWGEFHRSKMIYDWFVRYPERIGCGYVTIG